MFFFEETTTKRLINKIAFDVDVVYQLWGFFFPIFSVLAKAKKRTQISFINSCSLDQVWSDLYTNFRTKFYFSEKIKIICGISLIRSLKRWRIP